LLGQGGADQPSSPQSLNLPMQLEPHEGFAKPKGGKKIPFPTGAPSHAPRPGFKPQFEKGNTSKFAKGFKKDRGPRY
jgi:hypothetical protein